MNLELDNKVALVTGSDRRTGEVIAHTLASEGARVIYHGNDAAPSADLAVTGDISTEEGASLVLSQIEKLDLSVDILVNNYGTADFHNWE